MAKRNSRTKRMDSGPKGRARDERIVAFAEQLGRIAGTFQAKAEGWVDPQTLKKQVASVRDRATDLLKQLAVGATKISRKKPAPGTERTGTKGRSGGVVDARGKKHRKPMPTDPDANMAHSQADKMRMAKTMVKTNRRRGRG